MIAPYFAILYEKLDRVVQRYGYCLALHGSMQRDLDLVLIPWVEDAEDAEIVIEAIYKFINGIKKLRKNEGKALATLKPHGRKAYAIYVGWYGYYLDISVMPKVKPVGGKEAEG